MMITADELRIIALNIVSENQSNTEIDSDEPHLVYTTAYNDGVLDFLNAIIEKKGETV